MFARLQLDQYIASVYSVISYYKTYLIHSQSFQTLTEVRFSMAPPLMSIQTILSEALEAKVTNHEDQRGVSIQHMSEHSVGARRGPALFLPGVHPPADEDVLVCGPARCVNLVNVTANNQALVGHCLSTTRKLAGQIFSIERNRWIHRIDIFSSA